MLMKNFFTVLGGMGTLATESFVHVLNKRTPIQRDQDYLNYLLVNHATVPDRTKFILGQSDESPLEVLQEDLVQYSALKPDFFVLTCNTAHHFYDELSQTTEIPILHMPRLAVTAVQKNYAELNQAIRVGVLATTGTIQSKIYRNELNRYENIEVVEPDELLQEKVMTLIYRDIKENNFLNEALFDEILEKMLNEFNCDVILLGCTELSLIQEETHHSQYPVIDAQSELVNETIRLALANRKK